MLGRVKFNKPEIPIFSNVTAEPYPADEGAVLNLLVEQVTSPVEWERTVKNMRRDGAQLFLEVLDLVVGFEREQIADLHRSGVRRAHTCPAGQLIARAGPGPTPVNPLEIIQRPAQL